MDAPRDRAAAPACDACEGTGFVRVAHEDGIRVRRCGCREEKSGARRRAAAAIPPRYAHCRLDGFHTVNPSLEDALRLGRRLVDEFPGTEYGLLLSGPCGVGKTHLGVAILRELIETRGATGLFAEFNDLLRRLQETYDRKSETPSRAVLAPLLEADVLLLDDVGATRMTPWMQDTLGLIVNERYNGRGLTMITTNFALHADAPGGRGLAERIGVRIASRLVEMCRVVAMDGEDFRLKVKSADYR